jgi:hypothetical protein
LVSLQTACYNKYFISKAQLEKLEAKVDQHSAVSVIIDGCDMAIAPATSAIPGSLVADGSGDAAADAGAPATEGTAEVDENIDPKTGCPQVKVNTASPLKVVTKDGVAHRVTPFNFAMTGSQLVSPDYDLLLSINDVEGAEVQTFSGWKTGITIGGGIVAAVATFVVISLTAGEERGFGQQ